MEEIYLEVKRSAGVAPEVNRRNPLHTAEEAHKWEILPGFETQGRRHQKLVQNRAISGPTKRADVLQKCLKNLYHYTIITLLCFQFCSRPEEF